MYHQIKIHFLNWALKCIWYITFVGYWGSLNVTEVSASFLQYVYNHMNGLWIIAERYLSFIINSFPHTIDCKLFFFAFKRKCNFLYWTISDVELDHVMISLHSNHTSHLFNWNLARILDVWITYSQKYT